MSLLVELPLESYEQQTDLARVTAGDEYDFATAGGMAWLSQLAYETVHPHKIDEVLKKWGMTRTRLLKSPVSGILPLVDTRGLVVQGWGATIVAFAGTDPLVPANWLTNFDTLPSADDLHTGFENAVKSVWLKVRSAVLARDPAYQRVFLTGHSLGGALAVVAAKFLWDDRLANITGVYTFGMPRCGGLRFADEYAELGLKTYRLVHGDDIVPTVPPTNLGFRHVGCFLSCACNATFNRVSRPAQVQSDEPDFSGTFVQDIRDLLHTANVADLPAASQPGVLGMAYRLLPPGIADHIPSRYLQALGFSL
jgi:triacylglycerol lipase